MIIIIIILTVCHWPKWRQPSSLVTWRDTQSSVILPSPSMVLDEKRIRQATRWSQCFSVPLNVWDCCFHDSKDIWSLQICVTYIYTYLLLHQIPAQKAENTTKTPIQKVWKQAKYSYYFASIQQHPNMLFDDIYTNKNKRNTVFIDIIIPIHVLHSFITVSATILNNYTLSVQSFPPMQNLMIGQLRVSWAV